MRKNLVWAIVLAVVISSILTVHAIYMNEVVVRKGDIAAITENVFNGTSPSSLTGALSDDLNGDGLDDLVIMAVYKNLSGGAYDYTGQVYIFYGRRNGFSSLTLADANATLNGTSPSAFGIHGAISDMNYDGRKDLVISASGKNLSGGALDYTGQVHIFYQPSNGVFRSMTANEANVTLNGSFTSGGSYGGFGCSTVPPCYESILIDDFNNDNLTDMIIPAPRQNLSYGYYDEIGQVYVFYGSSDGFRPYTAAEANVTLNGTSPPGRFGQGLTKGDYNNDGNFDLVVSAYYKNISGGAMSYAGQVYVFYGSSNGFRPYTAAEANATFNYTDSAYYNFGYSLKTADFNNDNIDDLVVSAYKANLSGGAYDNTGQAFILYGSNSVWQSNNITNIANATFNGSQTDSYFGFSAKPYDLNNDSNMDLIIGSSYKNISGGAGNSQGQTSIFFGTATGIMPATADMANILINGTDDNDGIGYWNTAGDYDGDGVKELVASAPYTNLSGRYGSTYEGQVYVFKLNYKPTFSAIPSQNWNEDSSITLNLSQYFSDVNSDNLNYTWTGNTNIAVSIDEATNIVTLSPNANWYGTEYITFYANDSYNDPVASNNITLTVSNTADCGDNTCDSSESCSSCASDCGACPAVSGSSTIAAEPKAAHTFTLITPEKPAAADFKGMAVSSITLTTDETATNVKVEVKEVSKTDVPMPETVVYKLIDIKASNIELKEAKIKFKVKLSWLEENDVEQGEVVLMHHKDSWKKLETAYTGKDDENAYYEAKTGSLSMFAISYQKKEEIKEEPVQEELKEEKTEKLIEPIQPVKERSVFLPIVFSVIAALTVIAIIIKKRKR